VTMSCSSPEHGVPSLSAAVRQVMLTGKGRCTAIRDIERSRDSEREERRKRIRSVIRDSEEEFVPKVARDTSDEQLTRKKISVKTRSTPKRLNKVCTPTSKEARNIRSQSLTEYSLLPPDRKRAVHIGTQTCLPPPVCTDITLENSTQEENNNNRMKTGKIGETDDKFEHLVNSKTEVADKFPAEGNCVTDKLDVVATEVTKNKTEKNKKPAASVDEIAKKVDQSGNKVSAICLPPGYGSDKLAQVVIRLLEEKVRVSSSHSERELFRKTIHVLLCDGCKDKDLHNKVRCRRCEERDKRKRKEDKKVKERIKIELTTKSVKVENKIMGNETNIDIDENADKILDHFEVEKVSPKSNGGWKCSGGNDQDNCVVEKSPEIEKEEFCKIDRDAIFNDSSEDVTEDVEGEGSYADINKELASVPTTSVAYKEQQESGERKGTAVEVEGESKLGDKQASLANCYGYVKVCLQS